MRMFRVFLVAALVAISGCATVEVKKTTDADYKDGLRFYRPDSYLLVTVDKDGNLQTAIVSLPNKKQEYVVRTKTGLGATEMTASLDGGWNLTQLGAKVDSKIPETITAVTGAVTATLTAARGGVPAAAPRTAILEPGLYRIEFDKDTGTVSGLTKVTLKVQ
jgi:hypothetical protein